MIKLENLSKYYKTEAGVSVGLVKANLEFKIGEFVAVVGESGSGKTTLLNVISGLDSYEDGEMYLFGEPTSHYEIDDLEKYRSTYVGFVFQNYNIIDSYTVLQNITIALQLQGYPSDQIRKRALELIERVGLTHRKNSKAAKLSGGEKQRVVIARALAKDCPIIVADEPTGNLDSKSGEQVMALLNEVSKDKLVIVVSHNYQEVKPYATRKIKIHDGQVVEDIKLKEAKITNDIEVPTIKDFTLLKTIKWSFEDLFSKPKRFIFLFLAQLIVMLLFTINFAGSLTLSNNLGNNNFNFNRDNFYTENRINIQRFDGQVLSNEEIMSLEKNSQVISIAENSMQFFDSARYSRIFSADERSKPFDVFGFSHNTIFSKGRGELQSGKAATQVDEVVLSNNFSQLYSVGEKILLTIDFGYNVKVYPQDEVILTITGFSKDNLGIVYLHELFGTPGQIGFGFVVNEFQTSLEIKVDGNKEVFIMFDYTELNGHEFGIPERLVPSANVIELYNRNDTIFQANITDLDRQDLTGFNEIMIDQEVIKRFATDYFSKKYEISLIVKDNVSRDLLLKSLDSSVYQIRTLTPPPNQFVSLISQIMNVVIVISALINLLFLYAILGLVIRNSMSARKKDFAIFRSIGTNQKTIGLIVILQQVIISVLSYVLLIVMIIVLSNVIPTSIVDFRKLYWFHYLFLFTAFLLFSIWLGFRFNKKIFKITVIKNLQIEEMV